MGTSYACEYFTGKICKDGSYSVSKKSKKAHRRPCYRSKIDIVVNSCHDDYACIEKVATQLVDSCNDGFHGCPIDDGCKVVVGVVCQNTIVSLLPLTLDSK